MKFSKIIILNILVSVLALTMGCTDRAASSSKSSDGKDTHRVARSSNTLHTRQAAMSIYAYQPVRALKILDTAVMVGNIEDFKADVFRARIYSSTLMKDQLDTMLHGPEGTCLDTARAIGERLLLHDSIKANLKWKLDVLEILVNTAWLQEDTTQWLKRSCQYVDICHQLGKEQETNALRMEAETGSALHCLGQHEQGMAKIDSVIDLLEETFRRENDRGTFDELDALIIAMKRKILLLASHDQYAETIPFARRINELLDDYEKNPDKYHDGSYREPEDETKRADYIQFYRNQAQDFIVSAYALMGEKGNMMDVFQKIESSVREASAREHIAQYNALQMQMEAERQQANAKRTNLITATIGVVALLVMVIAVVFIFKNRAIRNKNRLLAQQVSDIVKYKKMYWEEMQKQEQEKEKRKRHEEEEKRKRDQEERRMRELESMASLDLNTLTDEQLFQYIHETILRERLYLDPNIGRQTLMDRFQLSKERVGAIFSKGSEYAKLTSYIQKQRLEYAAKLLIEQPDKSIKQVSFECGFSNPTYFSNCFRQHFGISPTDFRQDMPRQEAGNVQ